MNPEQIVKKMFLGLRATVLFVDQDVKNKITDILLDLIDQELEYTDLDDFLFNIEELVDEHSEQVEKRYC